MRVQRCLSRVARVQKPYSFYDAQLAGRSCDAKKRLARPTALAAAAMWSRAPVELVALSAYRAAWPPRAAEHQHLEWEVVVRSFLTEFPQPSVVGHLGQVLIAAAQAPARDRSCFPSTAP